MKSCFACRKIITEEGWRCSQCGAEPARIEGFLRIPAEPEAIASFPEDAHEDLDLRQERSFWFRERNALIVHLLRRFFSQADSLAEVGCGTGFVLAGIIRANPALRCLGGELFLSGLRAARRRLGPNVPLLQMDARVIPFEEEFDVVCAFDVLEHIDDDRAALAEIFRAVKPGGGILLSVPQHPWLWSRADDLGCHKRRYRRSELANKVREAGFEVLFQTSFVSILLPAFILQRLSLRANGAQSTDTGLTPPPILDAALGGILWLERASIALGMRYPVGSSRFVVARRTSQ